MPVFARPIYGVIVNTADCVVTLVPVIVAVLVPVPVLLVTVNVALVAPARTTTLAGTVAFAVLLLVNFTVAPSKGAGPSKVTVPVEVAPP